MFSSAREYYNALNLWRLPYHRGHLRVTDYLKNGGTLERAAHGEPCYAALLILDEAHHAAQASGSRYAIDSQFTRAIRGLALWRLPFPTSRWWTRCLKSRKLLALLPYSNPRSNWRNRRDEILGAKRIVSLVGEVVPASA